jgi:exodeoxyribonuclease III
VQIATWNVNSLKVRLPHVLDWLLANPVDVLCLQETKLTDDKFPEAALADAGYGSLYSGQPTYNGVAILTRRQTVGDAELIRASNPHFADEQKRLICARVAGLLIVCAYFPNGQAVGSEKFFYKLAWIDGLAQWIAELRTGDEPVVLAGDFNIAPEDRDVHDPVAWAGQVLCSEPERQRFQQLISQGFADTFRLFEQPPKIYSWWDYRQLGFRRNAGLRIDLILTENRMTPRIRGCRIDKEPRRREQPSDHAPVIVELQ